ncbi:putative bifunctional diguanylate cyclase/phosphodiesterase [Deinococcus maricopensis]|uniref:Diguanylate cyclase/phosphodiesterase with PAS/PAC and GAF sensor(S) n=1 Tax=Deinococcus maricopensis (strain DSM 21211 / LMG 22137 / NRRL B-23946 / LB-34) TaxID=709986 RepID=E8U8J1_DEIML|nr:EAL domain-containing protein [Deinococcus maricopensis]ADV67380.1 diguanylate cyclase/phosphodiesterase with PAS/PAC and GAF sensor(s) [Deinococcus maricopensis DSM 21211]
MPNRLQSRVRPPRATSTPPQAVNLSFARARTLSTLAGALTQARTADEIRRAVLTFTPPAVLAYAINLMTLGDDQHVHLIGQQGYALHVMQPYAHLPLTQPAPSTDVIRSGEALYLTRADLHARYPDITWDERTHAIAALPLAAAGTPFGAMVVSFDDPGVPSAETRAFLEGVAGLCAVALERAAWTERAERAIREQAEERAWLTNLADASARLADARGVPDTLSVSADVALTLGDWTLLSLPGPDGTLHARAIAHTDPVRAEGARAHLRAAVLPTEPLPGLTDAYRSARPVLHSDVSPEALAALDLPDAAQAVLRQLRVHSVLHLPLLTHGRAIGVLTVLNETRPFEDGQRLYAQNLAGRIAAALDNALLYQDVVERASGQEAVMEALTEGLLILDEDGTVILTNPSAPQLLGLSPTSMIGVPIADLVGATLDLDGAPTPVTAEDIVGLPNALDLVRGVDTPSGRRWFKLGARPLQQGGRQLTVCTFADVTDAIERERRLVHLAHHDDLTGLPNRRALREHLQRALHNGPCSIALLDLQGFKGVNDTYGHDFGDQLLIAAARALQAAAPPGAILARPGGDEFALLLCGPHDWAATWERWLDALSVPLRVGGTAWRTTVNAGYAVAPEDGTDVRNLLAAADLAQRAAKHALQPLAPFRAEYRQAIERRTDLEQHLRVALQRHELRVALQPILHVHDLQVMGYEALARWIRPDGQFVSPAEFIAVAESTDLIHPLGRQMAHLALRALTRPGVPEHTCVTINVSAVQLGRAHYHEELTAQLRAANVPPNRLILEVTESAVINDQPTARRNLLALAETGVHIALDDFGHGYSSLKLLQMLPFTIVKIDAELMRSGMRDPTFLRAIIQVASATGASVVAEGVETDEQLRTLRDLNVPLAQGYLLGRPQLVEFPPDTLTKEAP